MLIDYNPNVANPYTGRISVHHNLFAHHFLRTPQAAAGAVSTAPDLPYPLEIVNNVIHDVARHAVMIMDGACGPDLDEICDPALSCVCAAPSGTGGTSTLWRKNRVNLVGNTFSLSAETLANPSWVDPQFRWLPPTHPTDPGGPYRPRELLVQFNNAHRTLLVPSTPAPPEIHSDDNRSWRRDDLNVEAPSPVTDPALPLCTHQSQYFLAQHCTVPSYFVPSPHPMATSAAPITVQASADAESAVLAGAGALYRDEDPVDLGVVAASTYGNHDGTLATDPNPPLPPIAPASRDPGYDQDSDGMEDAWEVQYGITEGNDDADGDGYTNLEEFINGTYPLPSQFATENDDNDGWVLEQSQNAGTGGSVEPAELRVGDLKNRKQLVSILSFDTSALPDDAAVTSAELTLTLEAITGSPTGSLGALVADVRTGHFGAAVLESSDFEAAPTAIGVATLADAGNGTFVGSFSAAGLDAVNRVGRTQLKLRFTVDDDDDHEDDTLIFSTAGGSLATLRVVYD
jgi:hypothetical protein